MYILVIINCIFFAGVSYEKDRHEESSPSHGVDHTSVQVCVTSEIVKQENKNIKNVKRCRDGMPKSMQTR